jgi:hypothetical protein
MFSNPRAADDADYTDADDALTGGPPVISICVICVICGPI